MDPLTPWIPPPRFQAQWQVAQPQAPVLIPRRTVTFYKIGIGVIVPTLASTPTCSTPDLAIVVSPYDGFTSPSPSRFASIYTSSFTGGPKPHHDSNSNSSELEFFIHHELSTLLHDTYTLRAPRVLVGVFPIAEVREQDTPRQVLHEYLLRAFNGRGVFQFSSLWSNTTWVFTVLEHLSSPYAFYAFSSPVTGKVPKPINVLSGWELQKYGGMSTFSELEERLMAIWRRRYRKCDVEVGRVRMRCLYDFTPKQIVPGRFGAPVRPRRNAVVQLHQPQNQQYQQHQCQYQHHNQYSHSSYHYHPYHLNRHPHHQSYHQNQNQNLPSQPRYNQPVHPHPHPHPHPLNRHPSRVRVNHDLNDSCIYNVMTSSQNSGTVSSEPRMIYESGSVRSAFGDNTNRF